MPIYEYVCRSCGEQLEQLQRLSDDALTDCPACGESALKRKVSAAGFRLSGGGWYETDFKSDRKRNLAGADDKSSAGESKSGEGKSGDGQSSDGAAKTASKDNGGSSKSEPGSAGKSDKSSAGDKKGDKKSASGSSSSAS